MKEEGVRPALVPSSLVGGAWMLADLEEVMSVVAASRRLTSLLCWSGLRTSPSKGEARSLLPGSFNHFSWVSELM